MMAPENTLTANQEDHLEAIYHISAEKMAARAKDISKHLGIRASSVTGVLRTLGSMGLINYAPYDLITLTENGRVAAKEIVRRHVALEQFLVNVLGVGAKEAHEAACKMEHFVPKAIVVRLAQYAEYVKNYPKGKITWDSGFRRYYCESGNTKDYCQHRLDDSPAPDNS